jgi:hypothetical protein
MTMNPTMPPTKRIITGSISAVSAFTFASTLDQLPPGATTGSPWSVAACASRWS